MVQFCARFSLLFDLACLHYIYIYIYICVCVCVCVCVPVLVCIRARSREVSAVEQPCEFLQRPEAHGLLHRHAAKLTLQRLATSGNPSATCDVECTWFSSVPDSDEVVRLYAGFSGTGNTGLKGM